MVNKTFCSCYITNAFDWSECFTVCLLLEGLPLLLRQVLSVDRVPTRGEGKRGDGGYSERDLSTERAVVEPLGVIQGAQTVQSESRNHSWVSFLSVCLSEVGPEESAEASFLSG